MRFKIGVEEGCISESLWKNLSLFIGTKGPTATFYLLIVLVIFKFKIHIHRRNTASPFNDKYKPGHLYWMDIHFMVWSGIVTLGLKFPVWYKWKKEEVVTRTAQVYKNYTEGFVK